MSHAPHHIYINGRFLTQPVTGVQRYAAEVVKAMDRALLDAPDAQPPMRFTLLVPNAPAAPLALEAIEVVQAGRLKGHLWEQLELPFFTRDGWLLSLGNTGPAFKRRQIVTIHDAAFKSVPAGYSFAFRTVYSTLLPLLSRSAARVFTVSAFSSGELQKWFGVPERKIRVVIEGREHFERIVPDPSIHERFRITPRGYVLAVSTLNPNKNFRLVVRAVELLKDSGIEVVIAGGADPRIFASDASKFPDYVKHIGYVQDAELKALYEGAICLIYPSLYEGFGLPPLEAMTCGCPVIASREASLPEVCGQAALYCDAHDAEDLAAKIRLITSDRELEARLREEGTRRSRQFSWTNAAADHLAELRQLAVLD